MANDYKPLPRIKKVINISKIFDDKEKSKAVIIVDENEEKYSFFRTEYNKDTPSEAYGYLCEHKLKEGDTIGVQYYMKGSYQNVDKFYEPEAGEGSEVVPFRSEGELALSRAEKELLIARQVVGKIMGGLGLKYDESQEERTKWLDYIIHGDIDTKPDEPVSIDPKTIDLEDM